MLLPKYKFKNKLIELVFKILIIALPIILTFMQYSSVGALETNSGLYSINDLIYSPIMIIKIVLNTLANRLSFDLFRGLLEGFGWSIKWHMETILFVIMILYLLPIISTIFNNKEKNNILNIMIIFITAFIIIAIIYSSMLFSLSPIC